MCYTVCMWENEGWPVFKVLEKQDAYDQKSLKKISEQVKFGAKPQVSIINWDRWVYLCPFIFSLLLLSSSVLLLPSPSGVHSYLHSPHLLHLLRVYCFTIYSTIHYCYTTNQIQFPFGYIQFCFIIKICSAASKCNWKNDSIHFMSPPQLAEKQFSGADFGSSK